MYKTHRRVVGRRPGRVARPFRGAGETRTGLLGRPEPGSFAGRGGPCLDAGASFDSAELDRTAEELAHEVDLPGGAGLGEDLFEAVARGLAGDAEAACGLD